MQEIPLTDYYKLWADECAKVYGGMDLLAVDALHGKDGKDYILEVSAGVCVSSGGERGCVREFWRSVLLKSCAHVLY